MIVLDWSGPRTSIEKKMRCVLDKNSGRCRHLNYLARFAKWIRVFRVSIILPAVWTRNDSLLDTLKYIARLIWSWSVPVFDLQCVPIFLNILPVSLFMHGCILSSFLISFCHLQEIDMWIIIIFHWIILTMRNHSRCIRCMMGYFFGTFYLMGFKSVWSGKLARLISGPVMMMVQCHRHMGHCPAFSCVYKSPCLMGVRSPLTWDQKDRSLAPVSHIQLCIKKHRHTMLQATATS